MLDFRLDEEQVMLTEAIHRFAEEKMRKIFREAEEMGQMPADIVSGGWEMGLLQTGLPEKFDGMGEYSAVTSAVAMEEFVWGDLALTMGIMRPNLVAIPVMLCGTDEQKAEYLPMFSSESLPQVTSALTEPSIQFDPRNLKTTATKDGDNFVLNGTKMMVLNAKDSGLILVYANEGGKTQGFLVSAASDGISVGDREKLMGVNALEGYRVVFENVTVSASAKLGGEAGCDFDLILNHSRVALGAAAVGILRAGTEYAVEYAKQRVQFGKPVAQNQSIAFMLAEMATDVDQLRMMVWEAAWELDQGMDATRTTTVMKYHMDDLVVKTADQALQTLGGYSYIREYPVELWLRNARGMATFDGLLTL
jgi:acyl-CoA dehydrogenase